MRKRDAKQWVDAATRAKTYLLIAMSVSLVTTGLFFAGRQHFSSMDVGMKNSRLRKQIDELEAEKRRLLLAREVSMSPAEIKKAAKRVGVFSAETAEQVVDQVTSTTKEKLDGETSVPSNPVITKTVSVAPAIKIETASYEKGVRKPSPDKKTNLEKRAQSAE